MFKLNHLQLGNSKSQTSSNISNTFLCFYAGFKILHKFM